MTPRGTVESPGSSRGPSATNAARMSAPAMVLISSSLVDESRPGIVWRKARVGPNRWDDCCDERSGAESARSSASGWCFFRERPGVQHAATGHHEVLTPVQLVHDRAVADATDGRMPQRRTIAGAQREDAVRRIARVGQPRVGGQDAGPPLAANVVLPFRLACLILDGAEHPLGKHAVVRTRPAVRS